MTSNDVACNFGKKRPLFREETTLLPYLYPYATARAPAVQQYSWYSSTAGTAVQQVQHTLVLDLCVRDVLDVYTAGTAETLMYLMYIQQVQQK